MAQGSSNSFLFSTVAVTVIGLSLAANAQTVTSPFAKPNQPQAWETNSAPAQPTYPTTTSSYVAPSSMTPQPSALPPRRSAPSSLAGSYQASSPAVQNPSSGAVYMPKSVAPAPTTQLAGSSAPTSGGAYYPGRTYQPGSVNYSNYPTTSQKPNYSQYAQTSTPPRPPTGSPYPSAPPRQTIPQQAQPKSWADRMGLSNIATTVSGYLKFGAAATERNDWDADFIADGSLRAEASAITQGGLEYGVGGEVRAQYDKYRRGFGGLVGDCPPGVVGCASVDIAGTPTGVRGHTSRFYTNGLSEAKDGEIQLEGAYLFLRSAYGDVTVGRDDGAAYLFSLGAPTLVSVGASNSPADYTGLDAVKTINEPSGFAEKITYTSPRLLGDTVGVGVQFGASYAPNARACGVDYCVKRQGTDVTGTLAPELEDVMEFGLALDRKFDNGLSVEATATYATAKEDSGLAVFDDLQAFGLGVELGYMDWTVGGSYLDSNNGLANGDYSAWDVGLTWQPAAWGVTLGYGSAEDKNIGLKSDQAILGLSYDINDNYRIGTGVQYIDRQVPVNLGGIVAPTSEDATAIFIEGRVTF